LEASEKAFLKFYLGAHFRLSLLASRSNAAGELKHAVQSGAHIRCQINLRTLFKFSAFYLQ